MKSVKTTIATAALVLAAIGLNAQSTQFVKIILAENSNDSAQIHNPVTLAFNNMGDDVQNFPDAGNESYFGQFNNKMFPFTTSADGFVISNYDARPELLSYRTIPFGIVSKNSGFVKIIASCATNDSNLANPGFIWIEQLSTGERHSLLDTVKLAVSPNINYATDFLIHIGPPCVNTSTNEVCFGNANGTLHVQGPNFAGFTHELFMNNVAVYSTVVAGTDTMINNLAPGNYVSVVRINGIAVDSSDIIIAAAPQLLADFEADNNSVTEGDTVNFTDYSMGALTYSWNFGDGNTSATTGSAWNQYTLPGTYTVTLDITDANGCVSSAVDYIQVDADTNISTTSFGGGHGSFTGIGGNGPSNANVHYFRNTTTVSALSARIAVNLGETTATRVTIVAMNGTVVANEQQTASVSEYAVPASGAYIVMIEYTNGTVSSSTVVVE